MEVDETAVSRVIVWKLDDGRPGRGSSPGTRKIRSLSGMRADGSAGSTKGEAYYVCDGFGEFGPCDEAVTHAAIFHGSDGKAAEARGFCESCSKPFQREETLLKATEPKAQPKIRRKGRRIVRTF